MNYIRKNTKAILDTAQFYHLMKKEDIEILINNVLKNIELTFSVETDFIELIKLVDKSLWFDEWNFLFNL